MSSSRDAPTWIMYTWFYFRANRMASVSWIEQSCDVMDWLDMKKAPRRDSRTLPQRPQNRLQRLWLWTVRQEETTTVKTSYHWLQRDEAHLMEETFAHKYAGMFLFLFSAFYKKNVNLFCIFIIFRFISLNFSFIIFVFVLVFFLLFLNVLFWCPHVPTLDHLQRWWTQTTRGTKKIRLREEFAQNSPS